MHSAFLLTILISVMMLLWGVFRSRRFQREQQNLLDEYHAQKEEIRLLKFVSDNSSDGAALLDLNGRIVWANPSYCQTSGYRLSEMIGRNPLSFLVAEDLRPSADEIKAFDFRNHEDQFNRPIIRENQRKNGERFFIQLQLSRVQLDENPGQGFVVVTSRDVTEEVDRDQDLSVAHEQLVTLTRTDDLTGLANRKWFNQCLENALLASNSNGLPLALLLIDLDHFKEINDTHGHAAGDAMLCHVAELLEKSAHEGDLIARLGGDEFGILINNAPSLEVLSDQARKLARKIRAPLTYETASLSVSTTVGIARSEPRKSTISSLTRQADFALYFAKNERRGNVGAFDRELKEKYDKQRILMSDLADTLSSQNLHFVFQPVFDLSSGKVKAFETLCRWSHPIDGLISPAVFLPMVKEMRRTADLDMMAATAALGLLCDLREHGFEDIAVNTNVSPETLVMSTFSDFILWETERLDLANEMIQLEILEDTFFASQIANDQASNRVALLREKGFNVLLDDFGAGFAGLTHLATLDVSGIKIDRSLISPLPADRQTRIIVQSIAELSKKLGLSVVSEGVEAAEQSATLLELGCPIQQGYLHGRPMPRSDVLNWLSPAAKDAPGLIRTAALP